MSPVPANTVGTLLAQQMGVYMTPDLQDYLNAIGAMYEEVDELAGILAEDEGWSILLDPDLCPVRALPYLAMYVGERLPEGLTEVMQREWIKDAPNMRRGTLTAIIAAAQRTLTDPRAVSIMERSGDPGQGNAEDFISVRTYSSQTPDPGAVLQNLLSVVPADIVLDYSAVGGQTWAQAKTNWGPTWQNIRNHYGTWAAILADKSGYTSWQRPRPI